MIASAFRSAFQAVNSKLSQRSHPDLTVSPRDIIRETYRGLFNREPDPVGENTYQKLLYDGLQAGTLKIAEMLRSCIRSPEFHAIRPIEVSDLREPDGITRTKVEEVLTSFPKYQGLGRPGYVTNFLGCITNLDMSSGSKTLGGIVEDYPFAGNWHGGAKEWVGTLRAVLEAKDGFRMLELGAGWGPWCVIGYSAAVQRGISDIKVVGVEGDAGHVSFMEEHFAANGLKPDCYSIIRGVVGSADGEALFPKAKDPSKVYGGAPAFAVDDDEKKPFKSFMELCSEMVEEVERVPVFSLETLTAELPIVDLIHCDIQGSELDLFTNAIELISRKVKRVVIGTHSWQIDRGLIGVFASHGWMIESAEGCFYCKGIFNDGTQVWRNPLLTG